MAPRGGFQQRVLALYNSQNDKIREYDKKTYSGGADLGYAFGRFKEFRIGYEFGHLDNYTRHWNSGASQPLSGPTV